MKRALVIFAVLLMFVAACNTKSGLTIDGSSDETLKASIDQIRQTLDTEQKTKFEAALMVVSISSLTPADMASRDETAARKKMRESLHGKTAQDVIAAAEEIVKTRSGDQ
jgi:hypothetical protein